MMASCYFANLLDKKPLICIVHRSLCEAPGRAVPGGEPQRTTEMALGIFQQAAGIIQGLTPVGDDLLHAYRVAGHLDVVDAHDMSPLLNRIQRQGDARRGPFAHWDIQ